MNAFVPYVGSRRRIARPPGRRAPSLGRLHLDMRPVPYRRLAGVAVPGWQVDPEELRSLVAAVKRSSGKVAGLGGFVPYFSRSGLGSLGLSPTAAAATEKVASTAVGTAVTAGVASAIGTGAAAGSVAGPIGAAAGALIALAVSLFQKQYFNVAEANAACATQLEVWDHYESIQGHVAGRALGWTTMIVIWHGAVGAGLFPLNSQHLSFHEGTLNCAGTGAWSDSFLGETLQGVAAGCSADNCIPNAFAKFNVANVPKDTAPAVYFVDSIILPMNQGAAIPWITNAATNPVVHQLLYDVADAYLGVHAPSTVAYVEFPAEQEGTPTAGAENATGETAQPAKTTTTTTAAAAKPATVTTGNTGEIQGDVAQATQAAAAGLPSQATPAPVAATPAVAPTATTSSSTSSSAPTAAATSTPVVPYVSGGQVSVPDVEPTGATGTTMAEVSAPAAASSSGLSTTDWILIIAAIGAGAAVLSSRGRRS